VGIYDRDYYRDERPGGVLVNGPRSAVGWIIALNVAIWLADLLVDGRLSHIMAVRPDTITHPLYWWQFLTAGFAHDPSNIQHILMNMLGLFFLGRDVEDFYGTKEFWRIYLTMIVLASVVWSASNRLFTPDAGSAIGASGAVTGVVILYALNFPRRTLLLFGIVPVPAWAVGVFIVGSDLLGMAGHGDRMTAYSMHVTGAAFAIFYHQLGWNLGRWNLGKWKWPKWRRRPKLKVHSPDDEPPHPDLRDEVDRILEKIYRDGESSLSARERKTLETASKEYKNKKR
jgi:membrane associated rhomboid family serine protease